MPCPCHSILVHNVGEVRTLASFVVLTSRNSEVGAGVHRKVVVANWKA